MRILVLAFACCFPALAVAVDSTGEAYAKLQKLGIFALHKSKVPMTISWSYEVSEPAEAKSKETYKAIYALDRFREEVIGRDGENKVVRKEAWSYDGAMYYWLDAQSGTLMVGSKRHAINNSKSPRGLYSLPFWGLGTSPLAASWPMTSVLDEKQIQTLLSGLILDVQADRVAVKPANQESPNDSISYSYLTKDQRLEGVEMRVVNKEGDGYIQTSTASEFKTITSGADKICLPTVIDIVTATTGKSDSGTIIMRARCSVSKYGLAKPEDLSSAFSLDPMLAQTVYDVDSKVFLKGQPASK